MYFDIKCPHLLLQTVRLEALVRCPVEEEHPRRVRRSLEVSL